MEVNVDSPSKKAKTHFHPNAVLSAHEKSYFRIKEKNPPTYTSSLPITIISARKCQQKDYVEHMEQDVVVSQKQGREAHEEVVVHATKNNFQSSSTGNNNFVACSNFFPVFRCSVVVDPTAASVVRKVFKTLY